MSVIGGMMAGVPDVTTRQWLPWLLALAAIWGCSFLFIEVGVRELHPTYVTLGRVASGGLTLLLVLAIRGQRLPRGRRMWGHLVFLGTIGAALPFTLFGYGEQRISSSLAGIWNGTTPLVVLPFAVLVFRTERFTKARVTGLLVGFVGTLIVLGAWQGISGSELAGQLMCFGAAACYGVAIPYQSKFVSPSGVSDLAVSAGMLICATVSLLLVAPLLSGGLPPSPASLSAEVIASVLLLGTVGTGVAFLIHLRNIRVTGPSTASMVTYLIPLFAILVGVVVLDESLEWYQPVGALVVLSGVAVAQGRFRFGRRRSAPEPVVPAGAPAHEGGQPRDVGEVRARR